MSNWFSRLPLNARLAILAVVLGGVALFAKPTRQGRVTLDSQELALIVQRGGDHVSARTLADHLVKGQADFRVIDLRDAVAFARYHLPTAENIPMAALASAGLPRNDKLLLYADDGVHGAQAWFLLKAEGYPGVYILPGGLAEWRDEVLTPVLPAPTTDAGRRENEARAALAAYFGGAARLASAAPPAGTTPAQPQPLVTSAAAGTTTRIAVPPGPATAPKVRPTVKKKEGC